MDRLNVSSQVFNRGFRNQHWYQSPPTENEDHNPVAIQCGLLVLSSLSQLGEEPILRRIITAIQRYTVLAAYLSAECTLIRMISAIQRQYDMSHCLFVITIPLGIDYWSHNQIYHIQIINDTVINVYYNLT
jgi:hypothetical protein